MRKLFRSAVALMVLASPALAQEPQPGAAARARQAGASPQAPELPRQVKQKIQKTFDTFEQGWNQKNPELMSEQFAKDARLINPLGREAVGQRQIQELFRNDQQETMKESRAEFTVESGRLISPAVALVDMNIEIEKMRTPEGKPMPLQQMHGVALLTRQGDQWVIQEARAYQFLPQQPTGVGGAGEPEQPAHEENAE